jgi:hypothetical protein
MSNPIPHDRDAAVKSVCDESSQLAEYTLRPLSVEVYDHRVGVVHYRYSATIVPKGGDGMSVTGRWTEVYLKIGESWAMIAVSGRPDPGRTSADVNPPSA